MQVLMWLAEIMGQIRGESVKLQDNQFTDWACDPHTKVKSVLY
jgi:hypothetical protein